jgi:predicted DCC family thiol-disulfide oxidoreductase YuxK
MQILSWRFYDVLLTPGGLIALKVLMIASLAMAAAGYLTSLSTKLSALLFLFYQGLLRSFSHFNHDEMLAVYVLLVLAFAPCGREFSVDSWPDRRAARNSAVIYGYPILLSRILVCWVYFSSAIIKLRVAGLSYFSPDTIPVLAIQHSLGNLHDTQFGIAFQLAQHRGFLTSAAIVLVLVWELAFPLAIFSRRARWLILSIGVIFHTMTIFLMNFFFPFHVAMYAVFVDWGAVVRRVSRFKPFEPSVRWWHSFRNVPETFLTVVLAEEVPRQTFVWDGDCGFCRRWVERLRRFARTELRAKPFQELGNLWPRRLRYWSDCQMHWVDKRGQVVGGSRALASVLANTGHGFLAALLESKPLRPFAWLGYRLVARNRDRL